MSPLLRIATLLLPWLMLLTALTVPAGSALDLPWLLLGVHLLFDELALRFLAASALLWGLVALYLQWTPAAGLRGTGFQAFFLLAMAGNLLLIPAADVVTFYIGFAVMGLSAYGLILQRRSQRARYAGRLYLLWTLVGELALFCALVLLAVSAESLRFADLLEHERSAAAVVLLLLGFGIKVALPGLHVWLPLTYPAAPMVATAVLSGPMINAGLLGWLRFLPPGAPGLADWGVVLMALGTASVALGTLAGLAQRDPRAVLGYSSIAKLGLLSTGFGVALAQPAFAPTLLAALVLYALHHLLVKGALFLGMAEWERTGPRPWLLAGLTLLALALAGAPFTGGAAVKEGFKQALQAAGAEMGLLLGFAALGSVLLMARFLWLVARGVTRPGGLIPAGDVLRLRRRPSAPALWGLILLVLISVPVLIPSS